MVAQQWGRDRPRIDETAGGALELAAHPVGGRQHRHLKPDLWPMPRQIEEFEKVDVLRPQIRGAFGLDVFAPVLPRRDRCERGRSTSVARVRGKRPQIEIDRRPGWLVFPLRGVLEVLRME